MRFSDVYRTGRSGRSGGVRVVQAPGDPGPPQVGVVASRSVGNAVRRNRAKRRIREALLSMELAPDTAYVVISSKSVVDADFERLQTWLREAIDASGGRIRDDER